MRFAPRAVRSALSAAVCLPAVIAGNCLYANVSLALFPGTTTSIQIPASPPFVSLGDTRLELRLHDWKAPSVNATLFANTGFTIDLRPTGELCATDNIDALPAYGGTMCADITGKPDVVIRVQRDVANKLFRYEARSAAGDWAAATYCGTRQNGNTYKNTFPCPISTVISASWTGTGAIGGPYIDGRLAWVKWHSSLVPEGGGALWEGAPADLADWRFEGSLTNQGAGGYPVTLGPLSSPLPSDTAGGAVMYSPTTVHPPACMPGPQRTLRAGSTEQLDGSGSYPLDGGAALTYSWRQVSGPSAAAWSNASSAQPGVSGLVFGSYVFELTVKDSSGASNSCSVKHGAVASDANGVVITGNTAADTLLGPMIRFGANPWPWFDDRHKAAANMQIANLDAYYGAYWDPSSPAYGSAAAAAAWQYNAAPANYYDNVAGFYALYYRSGIDDYLFAARKLADRFWESPMVKAGTVCNAWVTMSGCYPARSLSVLGLVLRALDGRPDMWPGLHIIFNSYRTYYLDLFDRNNPMWDTREMAYHLAAVSYCALFDADPSYRQNCKASISASLSKIWTPARSAAGSLPALYEKTSSWETGTSVTLTNGSRNVTGLGTNWSAGLLQCANASGRMYPCQMWFTNNPAVRPANNAAGDTAAYTVTFVDATHLTLDRPYEGATGVHGWALPDSNAGLVGYGAQPFIEGILGFALDLAGRAIADTDPSNSALARGYNVDIANWLRDSGYWQTTKGMYYGAGFINCQTPISDLNVFCTGGNGTGDARVLNAEAMRGIMAAYAYSGDASLKTFGDTLYSAMFSKPGTGGPGPDGYYIDSLNDGTGWYMTGVPPIGKAPKYFGMFFGFGALSAWPAIRAGGAQPLTIQSIPVKANIPRYPGSRRARITVTAPTGNISTAECGYPACRIDVDPRLGSHRLKIEYLSEEGAVVGQAESTIQPEMYE